MDAEAAAARTASSAPTVAAPRPWWWRRLRRQLPDAEQGSGAALVVFTLAFMVDMSVLLLAPVASLWVYALMKARPARAYWSALLVYAEALLVVQYLYQVPASLSCVPDVLQSPDNKRLAELAGLHDSPLNCLPAFLVYLITLMHNYNLAHNFPPPNAPPAAAPAPAPAVPPTPRTPSASRRPFSVALSPRSTATSAGGRPPPAVPALPLPHHNLLPSLILHPLRTWTYRLTHAAVASWYALLQLLRHVALPHERSPHWIKVEVSPPPHGSPPWDTPQGMMRLQAELQAHVDRLRDQQARLAAAPSLPRAPSDWDAPAAAEPHQRASSTPDDGPRPRDADLSRHTRLQLRLHQVLPPPPAARRHGPVAVLFEVTPEPAHPVSSSRRNPWIPPLIYLLPSVTPARDAAAAICRLMPPPFSRSRTTASPSHTPLPGALHAPQPSLPLPASTPIRTAPGPTPRQPPSHPILHNPALLPPSPRPQAAPTQPQPQPQPATPNTPFALAAPPAPEASPVSAHDIPRLDLDLPGDAPPPAASPQRAPPQRALPPLEVVGVESHSQAEQDYYAASALFDFLSFVYAAIFYQMVVNSAKTLADITDEKVLPTRYLAALIVLFLLLVADRVAYSLGSPLAKLLLHLAGIATILPWVLAAFWSPAAAPTARRHLRVFMLLKAASFALAALQLRSGYPPPASYAGGRGRHSFFLYRGREARHMVGFYLFYAVPFLYELRALLDWTCTPTTLPWYDWLKLEDIRASLYIRDCNLRGMRGRRMGQRVPRYIKFLQGAVLFTLLLVVLWLPLVLFSSGAPTYQAPQLQAAAANISVARGTWAPDAAGADPADADVVLQLPLFRGGDRRAVVGWPVNASLPASMATFTQDQVKLVCLAQDSDRLWRLSPPARGALEALLKEPSTSLFLTWTLTRSAPAPSARGGPLCSGTLEVPLADPTRAELLLLLQGQATSVTLRRKDSTPAPPGPPAPNPPHPHPHHDLPDAASTPSPLVPNSTVQHSAPQPPQPLPPPPAAPTCSTGGSCSGAAAASGWDGPAGADPVPVDNRAGRSLLASHTRGGGGGGSLGLYPLHWLLRGELCSVRMNMQATGWQEPADAAAGLDPAVPQVTCTVSLHSTEPGTHWWRFSCAPLLANVTPAQPPPAAPPACPTGFTGLPIVAILERVQSGILGATLSSFGITGLYITFVYGIGRFLRLSVTNLRLKIPYEDLPSTTRLVNLCQDIYIARAEGELALEEELYLLLIAIYRSPVVMFELTKEKQE